MLYTATRWPVPCRPASATGARAKERSEMRTLPFSRQNPIEHWNRPFEQPMKLYLTATEEGHDDEKNPWMTLQRQFWKANPFSRVLPLDPAAITDAFQQIWLDTLGNPERAWSNALDFAQKDAQIMAGHAPQISEKGPKSPPVIQPEKTG